MTTHAVQNTMMHWNRARGSLYMGDSVMTSQSERKATLKKCQKRTAGFWIRPPRRPTGPLVIPSWK